MTSSPRFRVKSIPCPLKPALLVSDKLQVPFSPKSLTSTSPATLHFPITRPTVTGVRKNLNYSPQTFVLWRSGRTRARNGVMFAECWVNSRRARQ